MHKSREADQITNRGAEQLPEVRAFIILFWFFTYFKLIYSVLNVSEPFTFKIFTKVVNKSRIVRLGFHLLTSQSMPEVMIKTGLIPKEP